MGFQHLDAEALKRVSSKGGKKSVKRHRFTKEEAREAGKRGALVRWTPKRKKNA
jgi:general stress protein YciG